MLELLLFVFLAAVGIVSGVVLLAQKSLFKSAISLAILFVAVGGFILLTNQTLITLFQLFILVGGLSTYLIVAVASERESAFRHVDMRVFAVVFVLFGALMVYAIAINAGPAAPTTPGIMAEVSSAIGSYYGLMGAVVFLMFAIGIGSIMLIKKVVRIVV
ncbi:MAG: hypothetical protein KGH71_01315 [Candidatus Micrarchaeota archaeon]|nr:hypothetical protein [Candidatus Micrarchaeota archaeon]